MVERLRRALCSQFAFVRCSTVVDAMEAISSARVSGLLLEPTDARGASTVRLAHAVRRRDSNTPVIALVRRADGWSPATLALLGSQPTSVELGEDLDLDSVVESLSTRLRQADVASTLWSDLADSVPEGLRPLVRFALSRSAGPLTVQTLADGLGLHRKTLWSRCRQNGVGNVQMMVTWCRLLTAAHALRSSSRPIDVIAEDLAFASPTALRNAIRRHLQMTPTELRMAGGQDVVGLRFVAWMRQPGSAPQRVMRSDVA